MGKAALVAPVRTTSGRVVQLLRRLPGIMWAVGTKRVKARTSYLPSLQLVPFLPSNIPYALETLCTGALFTDGGHSFLENL